mmetsp:Transcript_3550/g.10000  ORF Transcript_3550/g.10000 Transcript_3550/m.10000 type:complete len:274 (+) Transcript_3550:1048-1869(+)
MREKDIYVLIRLYTLMANKTLSCYPQTTHRRRVPPLPQLCFSYDAMSLAALCSTSSCNSFLNPKKKMISSHTNRGADSMACDERTNDVRPQLAFSEDKGNTTTTTTTPEIEIEELETYLSESIHESGLPFLEDHVPGVDLNPKSKDKSSEGPERRRLRFHRRGRLHRHRVQRRSNKYHPSQTRRVIGQGIHHRVRYRGGHSQVDLFVQHGDLHLHQAEPHEHGPHNQRDADDVYDLVPRVVVVRLVESKLLTEERVPVASLSLSLGHHRLPLQ